MVSLVKGVRIGDFNRSGLVVSLLVLLMVVALFFIPELVNLESTPPPKKIAAPVSEKVSRALTDEERLLDLPAKEKSGGLEDLSDLVAGPTSSEKGGLSKQREAGGIGSKLARSLESLAPVREERPGSLTKKSASPLDTIGDEIFPEISKITQEAIRGASAQKTLKTAQADAQKLLATLDESHPGSRFALMSFIQGISQVLKGGDKTLKPSETVSYLSHLDEEVTLALVREDVDRTQYIQWAEISLGPVLGNMRSVALKNQLMPRFNPNLTVTSIDLREKSDRFGRPSGKTSLKLSGIVVGADISKVVLLVNGIHVREWNGKKAPKNLVKGEKPVLKLKLPKTDGRGLYTFVVFDRVGNTYEKSYLFYDRALRFPWDRKTKRYYMPFSDFDARIDKYFRVRVTRSGAGYDKDSFFGGDGVGRF